MEPDWNFYKYLMDHEGKLIGVYPTRTPVGDLFNIIEKAVQKAKTAPKNKDIKKDEL